MKRRVFNYATLIVAVILVVVSTIVINLNRTSNETYYLNDNKFYFINDYTQIIDDINFYNSTEDLYLVDGYFVMHVNESGEISELSLKFINSDNTKLYSLEIKDNLNKLSLQDNKKEQRKIIPIKDYFNVCYIVAQKFVNKELWVDSELSLMSSIGYSQDNFIYENKEIVEISNEVQGEFYEFKFYDINTALLYAYIKL